MTSATISPGGSPHEGALSSRGAQLVRGASSMGDLLRAAWMSAAGTRPFVMAEQQVQQLSSDMLHSLLGRRDMPSEQSTDRGFRCSAAHKQLALCRTKAACVDDSQWPGQSYNAAYLQVHLVFNASATVVWRTDELHRLHSCRHRVASRRLSWLTTHQMLPHGVCWKMIIPLMT